ncbi:MAG: undecaprenyl/decaprenyl-phosphate alpha-N-acetylglucosaminyl 1-phosphate transferase [Candidatus Latescibacteria bacterium]|nr:undecaprenyl/decaprenyl-phosphate alpha-N-acetylglucosaminyl 1-phosphate transferase [Candidatus Latescibacterota bacterium]
MTIFVAALAVSALATPLIRKFAIRWRVGDKPNGRKIHPDVIPHLGGIALLLGVLAGIAIAAGEHTTVIGKALPATLLVVLLGLIDDTRNLAARPKLVVQVVAASMLVAVGFRLFTGIHMIDSIAVVAGVVTLLFIVGMLSSVNLVDGHDGLAAGVALIASIAFAVIGTMDNADGVVAGSIAIAGACLGFLLFNFPPARIYMGDTGAMLLGWTLAQIACLITMRQPTVNTFAAVMLVLGVPILDTLLAVARRIVLRAPLFAADHLHVHHVLRQSGLSPRKTLLVLYGLQAVLAGLGIAAATGSAVPVIVGLGVVTVAFVAFLRAMIEGRAAEATAADAIPQPVARAAASISFQSNFSTNVSERRTSIGR